MKPPNFLVLDEPTTHPPSQSDDGVASLDIEARERLEEVLQDYEGTICLVSHDIDFCRHVATWIIAMTPPGVTRYAGGYDYYHEKVTSVQVSGVSGQQKKSAEAPLKPETRNLTPESAQKIDKKELRKQRAQAREALYDKTKDLKKAIHKAEKEVERLEAEKATLTEQLSAPPETITFASLSRRLQQVRYEIDIATSKWEEATASLEKVVGDSGGG